MRGGQIAYSEFSNNAWTAPEFILQIPEVAISRPTLNYVSDWLTYRPFVVWQHFPGFAPDGRYAIRLATGWYSSYFGDPWMPISNPRVVKNSYEALATFEIDSGGNRDIYLTTVYPLYSAQNLTRSMEVDDSNASFASTRIITGTGTPQNALGFFMAGTWEANSLSADSIAVLDRTRQTPLYLPTPARASKRNPDISCGSSLGYWSIWESNQTGRWKLYGSYAQVPLVVEPIESVPAEIQLYQNYPNPFNSETRLGFRIQERGFVSLKVFDVLGREVATLVNDVKPPGTYEISWNAKGVASGVYFCKLTAGGFVQTRKLLLLR
jgi:hypothetical protein